MDAAPDKPIARWLRDTRQRQLIPDSGGKPWTITYFLERVSADVGWKLHRENYSAYENGRSTPRRETLAKFAKFWAKYGEPGPYAATAKPEPEHAEAASLIAALREQTAAMAANTAATAAYTAATNALVTRIDQLLPSDRIREMLAWAQENMPSSQSPTPTPGPAGSTARS